nr:DUF4450 domain-containing protein [uncultured Bacteroides sp.]
MKFVRMLPLFLWGVTVSAQPLASLNDSQRGVQRTLRYTPDGEDFVIVNGDKKFNRALYGAHTGFRVETGDVPEFALYLPRMGGNLSFGIVSGSKVLSLNKAAYIESRYRAGSRIYTIKDPLLGKGCIRITALSMYNADGAVFKIETENIPGNISLTWRFGGAADKRFSREGDLGVDPYDSFDLKPEYCAGNVYSINNNAFTLKFGKKEPRQLAGVFPTDSKLSIANELPVLDGKLALAGKKVFFMALQSSKLDKTLDYPALADCFAKSEAARVKLASQIKIDTPDPYFNTLGGTLAVAADAIWSGEVWLHGAIGWRMPLNGWRAAYTGDALGWHDRARTHFNAYAASQVKDVPAIYPHPTQDSAMNLARSEKKWGTQMYSNGYICRNPRENNKMHHYDMNLCYIDELLWHFNWTGDLAYAKQMWPVLTRHLAWEKRNFDPDNDGLYDAYCCIWASDALYYNSGAVTHSSAYNYRANRMAAEIAARIGEDPKPYAAEADKILKALNSRLWIPSKGHWAEYQDFMGKKKLHESAAVWTIYHAIDSDVQNPFQGYQATRYVDTEIPHIPVVAKGLKDEGYAVVSTTNWMPYSWSINNVAAAEIMHTSLAYWQAGRNEEAFKLLKSSVLDGMYLGSSPGNIGQISFYDAARGECYRDFGDPIGVASRALVQGLFGVIPDAMNGRVLVRPGFPSAWDHASISTPDINFAFKRTGKKEIYNVELKFEKQLALDLQVRALSDKINSIKVNGKEVKWALAESASGYPIIKISSLSAKNNKVEIVWSGKNLLKIPNVISVSNGLSWSLNLGNLIKKIYDPQGVLDNANTSGSKLTGKVIAEAGNHTLFVLVSQGEMEWWMPVNINVKGESSAVAKTFANVNSSTCEPVNMDKALNDSVSRIFKNEYLAPRSPYTTLQLPKQGIGEWCHPQETVEINDSGVRSKVRDGILSTSLGVPFRTPAEGKNVAFTSLWNNYPDKLEVELTGKASHIYLLTVGTTNHMQSHIVNGIVKVTYNDGSTQVLNLINPENWCPIEQDFFVDGLAFKLKALRPYRLHLQSGVVSDNLEKELHIKGVYGRNIKGGGGVLLDLPLDKSKELKSLQLTTEANDVIIGLMAVTLQR